jgi:hypothetical protein
MGKQITVLAKHTESKILLIRGIRVILDSDLAELYGVEVKVSTNRSNAMPVASPTISSYGSPPKKRPT